MNFRLFSASVTIFEEKHMNSNIKEWWITTRQDANFEIKEMNVVSPLAPSQTFSADLRTKALKEVQCFEGNTLQDSRGKAERAENNFPTIWKVRLLIHEKFSLGEGSFS